MFLKESVSSKFSLMQIVTHSDLTCSTRFSDGRDKFCQIHTNHVMKMNLNIQNFLRKKFFRILHFIMKLVEGCVFILNKCIYRVSYNTLYNYPLLFSHSYLTFRKGDQNQLNHSQQLTHSSHNLIGCCPGQPRMHCGDWPAANSNCSSEPALNEAKGGWRGCASGQIKMTQMKLYTLGLFDIGAPSCMPAKCCISC